MSEPIGLIRTAWLIERQKGRADAYEESAKELLQRASIHEGLGELATARMACHVAMDLLQRADIAIERAKQLAEGIE